MEQMLEFCRGAIMYFECAEKQHQCRAAIGWTREPFGDDDWLRKDRGGACEHALPIHGAMGYAKQFHIERDLQEEWMPRLAPGSMERFLRYLAENVLDQPKSC